MGIKNIILFIAKIIVFLQTTKQINRKIYSPEIYIRLFLFFSLFSYPIIYKKKEMQKLLLHLFFI